MKASHPRLGPVPRLLRSFALVWAVCVAVVVAIFAFVLVPRERADAQRRTTADLERRADVQRAAIGGWLRDALADARTVAGFPTSSAS